MSHNNKAGSKSRQASGRQRRSWVLDIQSLESRDLPTSFIWLGHLYGGQIQLDDGKWSDYSSWGMTNADGKLVRNTDPNVLPGPNDTVVFDATAVNICYVDANVTVGTLDIEPSFGKTIYSASTITVKNTAILGGGNLGGYRWTSGGTTTVQHGNLALLSGANMAWTGGDIFNLTISVAQGATLNVLTQGGATMSGSVIDVNGTLNWSAGTVEVDTRNDTENSNISIEATGVFNANGELWGIPTPAGTTPATSAFTVWNQGTLNVSGATQITEFDATFTNSNIVSVSQATLLIKGIAQQSSGSFQLSGGALVQPLGADQTLDIYSGDLNGTGEISGNLLLGTSVSSASTSPGAPAQQGVPGGVGKITVDQNLNAAWGTFNIDITPGGSYDQVVVTGATSIGNSLNANFQRSSTTDPNSFYKPALNTSLPIIKTGSFVANENIFGQTSGIPTTVWSASDAPTKYHHWDTRSQSTEYDLWVPPPPPGSGPPGGGAAVSQR